MTVSQARAAQSKSRKNEETREKNRGKTAEERRKKCNVCACRNVSNFGARAFATSAFRSIYSDDAGRTSQLIAGLSSPPPPPRPAGPLSSPFSTVLRFSLLSASFPHLTLPLGRRARVHGHVSGRTVRVYSRLARARACRQLRLTDSSAAR